MCGPRVSPLSPEHAPQRLGVPQDSRGGPCYPQPCPKPKSQASPTHSPTLWSAAKWRPQPLCPRGRTAEAQRLPHPPSSCRRPPLRANAPWHGEKASLQRGRNARRRRRRLRGGSGNREGHHYVLPPRPSPPRPALPLPAGALAGSYGSSTAARVGGKEAASPPLLPPLPQPSLASPAPSTRQAVTSIL